MIDSAKPDHEDRPPHGDGPRRPAETSAGVPMVSVVTAYFNAGDEVFETAACVLAQTLTTWEWIIVDDGSTDDVATARLEALSRLDPRVRVIRGGVNRGPGAARNRGVESATAAMIFFLDADDLIEPTMLEQVAWHLASRPEAAAASTHEVGFGAQRYLWPQGFDTPDLLLRECPVGAHAVAVRRAVFREIGGFDETIRGGMEDWELWFRLASRGHWGSTIPEFLSWYRRRADHSARWADWDGGERQAKFRERLKERYPEVFERPPRALPVREGAFEEVRRDVPVRNVVEKASPRALMLVASMTMSGADKHALHLMRRLRERGWDVTVAAIERGESWWQGAYSRVTTDVHRARSFVRPCDVPLLVRGLIESRRPDVVLLGDCELGYGLLPYLRARCPSPAYVDVVHRVEEGWRGGGHPRHSVANRALLDMTVSTSERVRAWMVGRGDDPERVRVCMMNEDVAVWGPDEAIGRSVRRECGIGESTPVILCVARLNESMRPMVFASAIRTLVDRGVEFTALVAGDGPSRASIERELRESIDRGVVRMLGAVDNDRVLALCRAADVFFLPSVPDGVSRAVHEAMAAGLAVVAADTAAQRELVTPGTGILVGGVDESTEASGYAAALEDLCRRGGHRREIGRAARARIEAMGTKADDARRIEGLLREAMRRRDRRGEFAIDEVTADESATRAVESARIQALADELWMEHRRMMAEGPRLVLHWPGLWPVTMGVLGRLMLIARSTPGWLMSVAARASGRRDSSSGG